MSPEICRLSQLLEDFKHEQQQSFSQAESAAFRCFLGWEWGNSPRNHWEIHGEMVIFDWDAAGVSLGIIDVLVICYSVPVCELEAMAHFVYFTYFTADFP